MTLLHTNRAPVWGQMERWGSRGGWSEAGPELPHTSAHSPRPCGLCRGPRPRRGPRPVSCPQRAPCRWAALSAVWSSRALCAPLRAALALFSQELVISLVLRTVPRSLWPPRSLGLSLCQPYGSVEAEAVGVLARAAPAPSADLFPPSPGSVLSPRSGRRRGRRLPGASELSGAFPPAGGDEQGVGEGTPRPRWPSGPA